jgi:hypothetical protein
MRACNRFRGVFGMPIYIPLVNEDKTLRVSPRGVGIRKWGIPYFSGTLFCLNIVFCNLSDNVKTVKCEYELLRLSGVVGEKDKVIKEGQDSFNLKVGGKLKRFWKFDYLPQPGNYLVALRLIKGTNRGEADLVYFDALPRDATSWSLQIAVIIGIIMLIIGGLLGKFVFG